MKVACVWFAKPTSVLKFADLCLRFSPQISIRKNEAVFIEIGKSHKLYTPDGFLLRMKALLRKHSLQARIGLGSDITDSLLRAKYEVNEIEDLPLAALYDFVDPFNQDAVVQKYLSKMIESFKDLGINNIAEFKMIPNSELVSRFGAVGNLAKQRVNFESSVVWTYWKPVEIISEKSEFPYFEFYGELEPILFELKKQLDQIFERLRARGLKAQKMRVKIYCETTSVSPKPYRKFDFEFQFAQSATKGALNIIKERLARDFERSPILTPLQGLETTVIETVKGTVGQKNLLHRYEEVAEQQEALLGHLTEIHGAENIFQAKLVEDLRPEKSWKKSKGDNKKDAVDVSVIPLRPTHLLKPERIEITAGFIHIRRKPYKIINWQNGVEKISGAWQDDVRDLNDAYDRNYFNVELESGVTVSIFQTPDLKYYLHGYFG